MNIVLLIARLLLAAVFAIAGIAKLFDPDGSRKSVRDFGVPVFLAPAVALLLPLFELTCAVALVRSNWVWWGAIGALVLLALFIAGISISLMRGRRPDCHCFGQLHSSPVGWGTLSRNAVVAGLAGLVAWQGPTSAGVNAAGWLANAGRSDSLVLVLALAVVAQAVVGVLVLYHLLRQNGRMLLRLQTIEAKLGIKAEEAPPAGLPVKSMAPAFSLKGVDGATVTLEALRDRGQALLLLFTEPNCGACDDLSPDVATWQRDHADRLVVVPISRGDAQANRAKSRTHNLQNVLLQVDREVAQAYRVENTPSAVLVTDGLIASPLAVGTEAIRALVKDATTPPPLKIGDRVPSLRLRDLNGGTMDLATLGGRRRLLLFWNPSCGFCQTMLEDVKAWEQNRPGDALELLVISSGSPKTNREQEFRAQVLLDPNFVAGNMFGAGGTPSAVVVDEHGRVDSEVGVGAQNVLALSGIVPADECSTDNAVPA